MTGMAVFRPKLLTFWLLLAATLLALPIAIVATCEVRGRYDPPPEVMFPLGPGLMHEGRSLCIGAAIGLVLTIALGVAARVARRRSRRERTEREPAERAGDRREE